MGNASLADDSYLQSPGLMMNIMKQGVTLCRQEAEGENVTTVINDEVISPEYRVDHAELGRKAAHK